MPRPPERRARLPDVKRKDGFAPIGAYAAIGDGRTVALVADDGSIDFMSVPALHSATVFAALLDPERGGHFVLQPVGRFDSARRYVERTNVLETVYTTGDGVVRVTEALTLQGGGLVPWRELARRVEGLAGEVELRWRLEPRFDWGRVPPVIRLRGETPVAEGCRVHLAVHPWEAGRPELEDDAIGGSFTVSAGTSALLAMTASYDEPIPIPTREAVERRLRETADVWRRWLKAWEYDGAWEEQVARSALALKLLVYTPDAAIIAAPTTSLPERIGGDKNYDYRYMWVRDSAFTLDAFMRLGLPEQVHESFCFLLRVVRETAPELRPFYSVDGHVARRHEELPLRGYRDSRPVRYGNAAANQLQLGTYGDLLETAGLYVDHGNSLGEETAAVLTKCLDRLAVAWEDPDSGIWELDDMRHYTSSKLSVWMAFDRALQLVECGEMPDRHAHVWRTARGRVREFVEEHCWSDELGSYVEYATADSLDAAVLRAARMEWPSVSPDRFARTVDTIAGTLDAGECLLYRTTRERDREGAFVACSFWLVDALARLGRVDEAAARFERLLGHANDLGLFSEEVDPSSGALLGNFPQGLSHLALINAAGALQDARETAAAPSARAGAARR
jgi:GH15 family glucan-1,4-alpha-glucosidase